MSIKPNTIPPRPAPMHVIEGNIPDSLKQFAQWVAWSWTWNPERNKWDKPPRNARTGQSASSTDPTTWRTFDEALRFHRAGRADGVGFVLTLDDPFVGIDLDKCIVTSTVETWASAIIGQLATYTEISPSGAGIRILACGTLPPGRRRKGLIEMYCDGRYVTITGHQLPGTPGAIEDRTAQLAVLHADVFAEPIKQHRPKTSGQGLTTADDEQLIARARSAANGVRFQQLWAGDTSGYTSASEADLALTSMLAFWTGPDRERIDRLFRASALCRDKWTEREDYRARTIAAALQRGEFYAPATSPKHRPGVPYRAKRHHQPNAARYGLKPAVMYVGGHA